MDATPYRLLTWLSDGKFHSGEALATRLGMGRSAVWKHIKALEAAGVSINAVAGKGYRLPEPLLLLDRDRILAAMDDAAWVRGLDIHTSTASTNLSVLERSGQGGGFVCLAEHQSAGRGRRGRHWVSPFGANLYLSVLWQLQELKAVQSALSPAIAVAVTEALAEFGIADIGLKWPNDLYWNKRKLAGILLELAGESNGPYQVVAGIGINVNMPRSAADAIDQPWVDVATITGRHQDRNLLAAKVLSHVGRALAAFGEAGFAPFLARWRAHDICAGRAVSILLGEDVIEGTGIGIDQYGALEVDLGGKIRTFHAGEVSVRL